MNLIWLSFVVKKPVGGVEVIDHQAAITHACCQIASWFFRYQAFLILPLTWWFCQRTGRENTATNLPTCRCLSLSTSSTVTS
jgi:hypothetical protein